MGLLFCSPSSDCTQFAKSTCEISFDRIAKAQERCEDAVEVEGAGTRSGRGREQGRESWCEVEGRERSSGRGGSQGRREIEA